MVMPFEWDVRISSKEHHGDRAHVQDDEPATGLHHLMGHYSAQTQLDERVAVEGMLLAIRPIRFLSRTIATFDYARELPVFTEFFDDWLVPDSQLRRRRRFPLHRV